MQLIEIGMSIRFFFMHDFWNLFGQYQVLGNVD